MMRTICCLLALLPLAIHSAPPKSQEPSDIPTNSRAARHAARLALQFLNYQSASPHQLLEVTDVKKATLLAFPFVGHKYYVEFSANVLQTREDAGLCSASVFFLDEKPGPSISVNCSSNKVQKQARDDDYKFYTTMKAQTSPLTGEYIPDSYGYITPQLEPVWQLAILGSSYVIVDKSTEDREYAMAQIRSVKQILRQDHFIAFNYDLYLHERPSEEIIQCLPACGMGTWKSTQSALQLPRLL
ncbi:PREDICTED: retinoic acid receptor responder protein 1-like [Nanorana parkeri]|uniref:retinoic acid receptor responder protein 1-like n=1 Tax=Nanorana parkeri TaxID=125878 RepID=UPI0008549F67|nr:PREDICTED: retinoic acid receptor responder protein 1-like [Nanorana parkeri]